MFPRPHRIWLYNPPVDMRKQFDGLAALAINELGLPVVGGDLFVFINRRRTQMKVLYYEQGGLCLWSKRLEKGHYHRVGHEDKSALTLGQLQCLIDGIPWQKTAQNKRHSLPDLVSYTANKSQ